MSKKLTRLLLFLTQACLPLYILRCKTFSVCEKNFPIPFTFLEVLILATFALWALWKYQDMVSGEDSLHRLLQRLKTPVIVPTVLLVCSALVSAFVSSDIQGGLGIFKAYFFEGFLLYIVSVDFLLRTGEKKLFLTGLLASGLWLALLSIGESVFHVSPFGPQELTRGRVSGVYTTSNAIGLFLGPLIPISLGWLVYEYKFFREKRLWLVLAVVVAILGLGIRVSGSRGSLLGLGLGLIFFVGYWLFAKRVFQKSWFTKLFLIISSLSLAVLLFFFLNIGQLTPKTGIHNSVDSRLCLWEGSKNLLLARPLQGSGLNDFRTQYPNHWTCGREVLEYAHNFFLDFWLQTGIVGLLSFTAIVWLLISSLFKAKEDEILRVSLVGTFVVILGHGLVDVPFFKNDLSVQFWLLAAFGSYLILRSRRS